MIIVPVTFTKPLQYACSRFSGIFACTSCPNCTRFFSLPFPPFSSLAPSSSSRCCHHCDRTLHNKYIFSSRYRCLSSIRCPLLWPGSFRSKHTADRLLLVAHSSLVQANWAMVTRALLLCPLPSPPHPSCNLRPRPLGLLISPALLLAETRLPQLIRSVRERSAAYPLSLTGIRSPVHVGTRRQRRQAWSG